MSISKCGILKRLLLAQLLPSESDITTLRIVRDLRNELSFSEDEHRRFEIKRFPNGQIQWDATKEEPKSIEIGEVGRVLIKSALENMDKAKKCTDGHIELYAEFVETDSPGSKLQAVV